MGTKNINNMVLEILLGKPQSVSEIQTSLGKSGRDFTEENISVSLSRLNRRGYIEVSNVDSSKDTLYVLSALGQAVTESSKK